MSHFALSPLERLALSPSERMPPLERLGSCIRVVIVMLSIVAASALASGCATIKGWVADSIEDPKITILDIELRKMSLGVISTTFQIAIENPNPVGLLLGGIEYQLNLEGKRFAQGKSQKEFALLPLGTTQATLDVDFPLGEMGKPLKELLLEQRLAYSLDAVFLLGTASTNLAIPARFEGVLALPKPPGVDVVEVSFPEVSLAGVQVRLLCHVSNPNTFDIPLDELRVSFSFGGREILSNQPVAGVLIPAGQTTVVPLDFSLSLEQLGLSLRSLADKPELRWQLILLLVSGDTVLPYERGGRVSLVPTLSDAAPYSTSGGAEIVTTSNEKACKPIFHEKKLWKTSVVPSIKAAPPI